MATTAAGDSRRLDRNDTEKVKQDLFAGLKKPTLVKKFNLPALKAVYDACIGEQNNAGKMTKSDLVDALIKWVSSYT